MCDKKNIERVMTKKNIKRVTKKNIEYVTKNNQFSIGFYRFFRFLLTSCVHNSKMGPNRHVNASAFQ